MNKKLFFLVLFSFLNISYQLDCSEFSGDTCEGHNTKYNLGCHKFSTSTKCREVEIDDGCKIDEQDNCVKTDTNSKSYDCYFWDLQTITRCKRINIDTGCTVYFTSLPPLCDKDTNNIEENEDCFLSDDYKTCAKKTKACNLYSDANCGGLKKITGNSQCIQLYQGDKCKEIEIDEDCNIGESSKECEPRSAKTLDAKHHCIMNEEKTQCKKQIKECKDFDSNECAKYGEDTCKKVKDNSKCKLVIIHNNCTIDDYGECVIKSGKTLKSYEICDYNSDFTECKPINKECDEMELSKCSECQASLNCKKVENEEKCLNVKIDSECEIDENGQCKIKLTGTTKSQCAFNSTKTGCIYREVDSNCKLTVASSIYIYCSDEGLTDKTKICAFDDPIAKTKCKPRQKICSDYDSNSCEAVTSGNKKCSYDRKCKEYTIDDYCTVNGGKCEAKPNVELEAKYDCIFNQEKNSCTRKEKKCENYFEDCNEHKTDSTTTQCARIAGFLNCKTITVDDYCHVNSNGRCESKTDDIDIKKICDFDQKNDPTSCKIRDKLCSEFPDITKCDPVEYCFYRWGGCYDKITNDYCEIQNEKCIKKSGANFDEDNEKCEFVTYYNEETNDRTFKCEKTNKVCSDYLNPTLCNNAPNVKNYKCHYLSSRCKNVTLDGNCIFNEDNKCVENGSGKLSSNEMCELYEDNDNPLNYYKASCTKREKLCSDFEDNTCESYSPIMKLCFNLDGSTCTEVKVDDKCTFDEDNECKGDNCKFDEENKRCYYEKNNEKNYESWLKLNQIILLMAFFMF